jgi:hypothetical protein
MRDKLTRRTCRVWLMHHPCHRKVRGRMFDVVSPVAERQLMKGLSRV